MVGSTKSKVGAKVAKAAPETNPEPPISTKPAAQRRRIAVVFVHGQGEQTPMTDVMQLAESVWRTDPQAGADGNSLADLVSLPVGDKEGSDQRVLSGVSADRQVDFYQFYWADLMKGNRVVHLWKWFTELMTRLPCEVPGPIWGIRQAAMLTALILGVWGAGLGVAVTFGALLEPGLAVKIWAALWLALGLALGLLGQFATPKVADRAKAEAKDRRTGQIALAVAAVLAGLLFWLRADTRTGLVTAAVAFVVLAAWRVLAPNPPVDWQGPAQQKSFLAWSVALLGLLILGAGLVGAIDGPARETSFGDSQQVALLGLSMFTAAQVIFPRRRALVMNLGALLVIWALASWSLTPKTGQEATGPVVASLIVALLMAGAVYWLSRTFLIPVMTDSARMFSNSPVNIPNQNAIRKRGLDLMRFLHDPKRPEPYDRVIVLAHSLGTVVAYRLLAHYWGSIVDKLDPAATAPHVAAVETAAAALARQNDLPSRINWRAAVRTYGAALRGRGKTQSPWKISDFVTIGSPLTNASLLMENSDGDFLEQVRLYKRYPTSPPQPAGPPAGGLFGPSQAPNAGALFAATTWTNLYFPPRGLGGGDLVGGPICGPPPRRLGAGVLDVDLGHDETVQGFAHNYYWRIRDGEQPVVLPANGAQPTPHVAALRDALRLFETNAAAADARLGDPAKSYANP